MLTTSRMDIILSAAVAALGIQSCCRHRLRHWALVLFGAVWLAAVGSFGSARANVVVDVNNALLSIIINTSASLVDGPPEVAREIALIDGAMFDAVNAASGGPYPPIAYSGGPVSGADPNAAALQAALTVMNSLYGPSSLYQQYEGVTGATYYPSIPGYARALVGPTATQLTEVARQISIINAKLTALHPSSTSLSLGTAAGNAMLAVAANDGGYAASLQTLTPFTPPNVGNPGVYVPPSNRPAMTPTWGTVLPIGISSLTLSALEAMIPVADAASPRALPHKPTPCRYCRRNARAPALACRARLRAPAARRVSPRRAPPKRRPLCSGTIRAVRSSPRGTGCRSLTPLPCRMGLTCCKPRRRQPWSVSRWTPRALAPGRSNTRTLHGGP